MNTEIIDCVCFHLPKTDEIKPMFCRPGYLYARAARTIGKGDRYISLRVLEKTEQDRQRKSFEELFRHCGHFPNKRGASVEQYEIGEHRLLLTIGTIKKPPECTLAGVIDLDNNHYLHVSASFSTAEQCYPNSENAWQTENLKREETVATLRYLLGLLENLQLAGNFSQVLQQVRMEEEQKQQAEQQKALQEKLAKAAQPIDCEYFSLPSTKGLTEVRIYHEQALLYFTRNQFSGEIDIRLQRIEINAEVQTDAKWSFLSKLLPNKYNNSQKNRDFLPFFRSQILPKDSAGKTLEIPIEPITLGRYCGCLALHLTETQEFQWIAAIDVDDGHYLTFIATYQKTDGSFTEADNPAAADIYRYVQSILNTLHIKIGTTDQDTQTMAWESLEPNERIHTHQQHYTQLEQQAADPFHARHYPAIFENLEKALKHFPDLSAETLQGVYTNARCAIGFMPTAVDDYSQKGNTRFYGLPDLPPGMEYPKCSLAKPSESQEGTLCKFFAQINFAELKGMHRYLPDSGILYLFIDSCVISQNGFGCVLEKNQAFYYAGDIESLQSAKDLQIKPEYIYDVYHQFETKGGARPARVQAFPLVNILDSDEENEGMPYPPKIYDAPIEAINQALLEANGLKAPHAINAHVEGVYNDRMEVNGEYVTSPYVEAAQVLGGKPEDYVVLLRLGAEIDVSIFMFGDGGSGYFMISKERLKNKDFSQIYFNATAF